MPDAVPQEPFSILVIDDEPAFGDALRLVLESNGYEVVLVENGRDGIIQSFNRRFSIVIIDLFLPDMSGLEVINPIREEQPETSIILISSQSTPQAFAEARSLGAVATLSKPFLPADILGLIAQTLAR